MVFHCAEFIMPKYAIFNTVVSDGMGDFSHFLDVVQALRANPHFKDVEFVPVVCFQNGGKKANEARVREKLDALGWPYVFGSEDDHAKFCLEEDTQHLLHDADQAIVISSDQERLLELYAPYMKAGIPIKLIAEHEGSLLVPEDVMKTTPKEQVVHAPFGLSARCSGIKIATVPSVPAEEAWHVLETHNPEFAARLLQSSDSADFESFQQGNVIVPAYFNNDLDFTLFLHRLGVAQSDFKDKDLVVYHSGSDLSKKYLKPSNLEAVRKALQDTSIKQIQVIRPGDTAPIIIKGNPNGTQSISVYSGFNLNDPSFDALYQMAEIAGVSGDNTFERCISMNILPFYWSTNPNMKAQTLSALRDITAMPDVPLSPEARKSFNYFFDPANYKLHQDAVRQLTNPFNDTLSPHHYNQVDLSLMVKEWPIVCDYLRTHKNFYNHIEQIVLAQLPSDAKSASCDDPKNTVMSFKARLTSLKESSTEQVEQPVIDEPKTSPRLP